MKKIYLQPILNVENAMPANLLCESFKSNAGLESGGGSDGQAQAKEDNSWDIWGE